MPFKNVLTSLLYQSKAQDMKHDIPPGQFIVSCSRVNNSKQLHLYCTQMTNYFMGPCNSLISHRMGEAPFFPFPRVQARPTSWADFFEKLPIFFRLYSIFSQAKTAQTHWPGKNTPMPVVPMYLPPQWRMTIDVKHPAHRNNVMS